MEPPFHAGPAIEASAFAEIRLRTIFECCKWDPQVEDSSVLAPFPLLLDGGTWSQLATWSEQLAAETIVGEEELLRSASLWRQIGLPGAVRQALSGREPAVPCARVMRFDFHFTEEGWRISEVNSDVPGGYIEASGFTCLMAEAFPGCVPTGDPAAALAEALAKTASLQPATIAMVHASAYSDDRQVMQFLSRYLDRVGLKPVMVSPDQISWRDARAYIKCGWFEGPADLIYRFYPAEWLPNLRRTCQWPAFYSRSITPQSNPGWAILSQSKRFGLLLQDQLSNLETWRKLLPETKDPREISFKDDSWILKPALGRVGDSIGIRGETAQKELRQIHRNAFFFPRAWVAQRRFNSIPIITPKGPRHFCLGVYTVNGRAAGTYCRCSASPIINHLAQDVAVLLAENSASNL